MQIGWMDYTVNQDLISIEVFDKPNPIGDSDAHGMEICLRPNASIADVLERLKEILAYRPN
jgi:hypothetical protein